MEPHSGGIILASNSPRRRKLLADAGIGFEACPPAVDDGRLRPAPVPAAQWAMSMAYLKARSVAVRRAKGVILAADTVCSLAGRILGQPRSPAEARRMLLSFRSSEHAVISGVCVLGLGGRGRLIFHDLAVVHWGAVSLDEIDAYVAGGAWRGKAGGYNLEERLVAGWPIECTGDPATVMGLPMARLLPILAAPAARTAAS